MNYKVKDTELTSIANAIRTKGGTSESLLFPNGFISAIQNIPSGGGSTLITKNITSNGIYEAQDDNADGYSEVTVSVPSIHVTGTFIGSTEGEIITISLPYVGTGHPVGVLIYPKDGASNSQSPFYSLVHRRAINVFAATKGDPFTTPNYSSNDGSLAQNKGYHLTSYKSSDSDANAYSALTGGNVHLYGNRDPEGTSSRPVMFTGQTQMKVFIASTSYGFVKDIEYRYHVMYSS